MRLNTLRRLSQNRRPLLIAGTEVLARAVYRANFLAAASAHGLLPKLAERPQTFDEIAGLFDCKPAQHEALVDWLSVAVLSGALRRTRDGRYALRSIIAKAIAAAGNDDAATAFEEITQLHAKLIYQLPAYLKKGEWFTLGDHDAVVAARASRALEPIMAEGIERAIERFRPGSYLDFGCGSGIYLRYAAEAAPGLTGKGIDLDAGVAAFAQSKLEEWGMADRFSAENGNLLEMTPRPEFDLASLINNICYFQPARRADAIRRLSGFVRPGGGVLVAHPVRGISASSDMVSLFFSAIEDAGPFPAPGEMEADMWSAGIEQVQTHTLVPGIEAVTGYVPS